MEMKVRTMTEAEQLLQIIKTAFQKKNVFVGGTVQKDLLVLEKAFDRLREGRA